MRFFAKLRLPRRFRIPSNTAIVAWAALIVSAIQLFFTVPLLTQFYWYPEVVVTGTALRANAFGSFIVANDGNATATKIEVGFIAETRQRFRLVPALSAKIVEEDAGFIKTVRVEVERLLPGEKFTVVVLPGPPSPNPVFKHMNELIAKSKLLFPAVSFVRSAEGVGRFVRLEADDPDWKGKLPQHPSTRQ